ncbi:SCP2 sterol-binding domain-containing protein [Stutzerimonas tarimensis]|uniref:SCP2 sterol-binding domain-containing protein n=1 Tax=Stutzerimonas tarimensis TaxID=1507735 RepID=A0ABV7T1E8_9GAMM
MSDTGDILQKMQSRFNPSAAAGLDLVYQFNITDADNYHIIIKDGTCDLQAGVSDAADVTLITDKATMKEIISGETSGMQAFMSGRLRTEGDMMQALKLGDIFPS